MSFDDPNRESVGQPPIWTGADSVDPGAPGEPTPEEFDPGEHTVAEVHEYLAAHPEDTARVVEAETAGKNRTSVTGE